MINYQKEFTNKEEVTKFVKENFVNPKHTDVFKVAVNSFVYKAPSLTELINTVSNKEIK